jgi:hypothetical protein
MSLEFSNGVHQQKSRSSNRRGQANETNAKPVEREEKRVLQLPPHVHNLCVPKKKKKSTARTKTGTPITIFIHHGQFLGSTVANVSKNFTDLSSRKRN